MMRVNVPTLVVGCGLFKLQKQAEIRVDNALLRKNPGEKAEIQKFNFICLELVTSLF